RASLHSDRVDRHLPPVPAAVGQTRGLHKQGPWRGRQSWTYGALFDRGEKLGHLSRSVIIADPTGNGDALLQNLPRLLRLIETGENLPLLKVGCDIVGIHGEDAIELRECRLVVPGRAFFHRQGVQQERVIGTLLQHLLELIASAHHRGIRNFVREPWGGRTRGRWLSRCLYCRGCASFAQWCLSRIGTFLPDDGNGREDARMACPVCHPTVGQVMRHAFAGFKGRFWDRRCCGSGCPWTATLTRRHCDFAGTGLQSRRQRRTSRMDPLPL